MVKSWRRVEIHAVVALDAVSVLVLDQGELGRALGLAPDRITVLETIAGQAALAVAMSRQHAETDQALRRRLSQISTLEAIGRDLNSTLSLEELLERVLGHALRYAGASIGHIALLDEATGEYRVRCRAEPIPGTGRLRVAPPDELN